MHKMTFPIVNDASAHSRVHTRSAQKKKTEQSKFPKYGLFTDTIEELFSIGSLQYLLSI